MRIRGLNDNRCEEPGASWYIPKVNKSFLNPEETTGKKHRATLSRRYGLMRGKLATLRSIVQKEDIQRAIIRGTGIKGVQDADPRWESSSPRVQPGIKHKQRTNHGD